MKFIFTLLIACSFSITGFAQVGIGTVSPNSTLDVRGSFSAIYRSFSSATSITSNDHTVVFTGSSAATATLPDATTCAGRIYYIKNFSASPITPILTIGTVSSQKIDGIASWTLDEPNEVVTLSSDGTNWEVLSEGAPASGGSWNEGGNSVTGIKSLGTISNYDLPIITNNTEKMRITSNGYVGIGSTAFSVNPEALLVYQNSASSFNVIAGKGNLNNYLQLNIQNLNGGTNASSDVVATADNGNEITNYVDMGINSSGNTSAVMGSPDDAYLYTAGNNFLVGTANAGKSLIFLTGGTTQSTNERMRIDGTGNVGIGIAAPAYRLQVNAASNPLFLGGVQTGLGTDSILTIINGVVRKLQPGALVTSSSNAWSLVGNAGTNPASNFFGTTDAQAFIFKENNSQVARFENTSIALGSGATTANSPNCYALGSGANIGFNKLNSVAIGTNATVSNDSSFAIGTAAATSAQNAFSIGSGSQANSLNSFAIGRNAYVGFSTSDAVAIGTNATVSGANAISIGSNITAANKTQATAASSIAMGNAAAANSANGIAIGTGATIGFSLTNPVAIGDGATANGSNSVALGNGAGVGFINNATALGAGASVSSTGNNSTALGYNSSATLANEVILGDRSNSSLSVGIGTESFSGSNREKLLVDAGATSSVNAIVGRGSIDSYLQLNIQNQSAGVSSSSDVVATANNGNETSNYVDMGINGGNYTGGVMGVANDAYLYNLGQNFLIGTGAASKSLIFMTGGTSEATNERMRIDGSGNLGLGTNAPTQKLDVTGNFLLSGAFMPGNTAGTAGFLLMSTGAGTTPTWFDPSAYLGTSSWVPGGNNFGSVQKLGATGNFDLPVITDNVERMRITSTGNVAIDPPTGVASFNATNPEKLLVDAGTTSSVNAIVGKGNNSTYLQLNIQNLNNGGNASSDVVATADNGNETTNYVDLGMNSSGNTSGVMGGADDAYLYTTGNNFLIGTATAAKALVFLTGGTTQGTNERMRITGTGNVGISTTTPNSTLQVGGSMALPWVTKTSSYTVLATDYTILCNNTSGAITITLPTASGIAGRVYVIKKISGAGNNVTIDGAGAETIDGSTTDLITTQYNSIMIQSDGTDWYILSKN
jgi:hypothetical protein